MEVRSNGGAFSLANLDFQEGRDLAELGLSNDVGSVDFASLKITFLNQIHTHDGSAASRHTPCPPLSVHRPCHGRSAMARGFGGVTAALGW
nr:hypothetical protein CFP56_34030 [Quercus suber]